jgi:hypothetical protein
LLNSGRVELLDNPRLLAQLQRLERRVGRSGRDSIDHAPGSHDDVVNAAGGALVLAADGTCTVDFLAGLLIGKPLLMSDPHPWPSLVENPDPTPTGGVRGEPLSVPHRSVSTGRIPRIPGTTTGEEIAMRDAPLMSESERLSLDAASEIDAQALALMQRSTCLGYSEACRRVLAGDDFLRAAYAGDVVRVTALRQQEQAVRLGQGGLPHSPGSPPPPWPPMASHGGTAGTPRL